MHVRSKTALAGARSQRNSNSDGSPPLMAPALVHNGMRLDQLLIETFASFPATI